VAGKNVVGLVYVDTSGWYALVDETDPDHQPDSDLMVLPLGI